MNVDDVVGNGCKILETKFDRRPSVVVALVGKIVGIVQAKFDVQKLKETDETMTTNRMCSLRKHLLLIERVEQDKARRYP